MSNNQHMYQKQQHQQNHDQGNTSPFKGNFEHKIQHQQQHHQHQHQQHSHQQQQQHHHHHSQQNGGSSSISKQSYQQVQMNGQHQQQQQQQQQQQMQNGMVVGSGNLNGNSNGNGNGNGNTRQVVQSQVSNTGKYKTSICRHFMKGNCQLGTTCHFAHGNDEMRTTADPLPQNIPSQPKVVCNNFKTVKCRYYERGFCKNQNACCFAHGDTDLVLQPQFGLFSQSGIQQMQPMVTGPQPSKFTDSMLLIQILVNLEKVFFSDAGIIENLQYAQNIAKQGDQKGAFNIISDIMKDPKRTEEEKTQYNTIYNNASMYQNQLMQQMVSHGMVQVYPQMQNSYITQGIQEMPYYQQQYLQQQPFIQKQLQASNMSAASYPQPNIQMQPQSLLMNIQFQSQI